jgi:hypothetical protein
MVTDRAASIRAARKRLDKASMIVAALIDNDIDPPWCDSQELENAAIALGRLLNAASPPTPKRTRKK